MAITKYARDAGSDSARLEAAARSETAAVRVVDHVKLGKENSIYYAIGVNEALWCLTAMDWHLSHEQANGRFPENQDGDVQMIASASSIALRNYPESESDEDNAKTATILDELKASLAEGNPMLLLRQVKPMRYKRIVQLDDIKASASAGRYDLAINRALVYLVDSYVQLKVMSSSDFAKSRIPELEEAADVIADSLDRISEKEGGALMQHDRVIANDIRVFGRR